jgi:tRNA pseudouridine55 synthase
VDGVVVIDKPQGLTSHDVVAAARRALREKRIGHTGTLDPMATGVLPLACGRATRLVRFLTASEKDYEAVIVFGFTTDTLDVTGSETSRSDRYPGLEAVERSLASLTGDYLQMPPAYSAKKVAGTRAYELARRDEPVALTAVPVKVPRVELLSFDGRTARVALTCSAGFYVRSFAHSVGELAGTGACLQALRRTRSGEFGLGDAVAVTTLVETPETAAAQIVPLERLLERFPAVHLTSEERSFVAHGRMLERSTGQPGSDAAAPEWVRLVDPDGRLVALATPGTRPGSLHPAVVLI